VALVDPVTHGLADEVIADGEHLEPVLLEDVAAGAHVPVVAQRLVDLEVIAPAGELEAVETPRRRFSGDGLERKVGPLSGEECDWSWHLQSSLGKSCVVGAVLKLMPENQ
jgi:hypothetical protein